MTDARDKLPLSIRQWLEQFAKSYNPKGYTDAAILTGEALFAHLTSQSVEFDAGCSYCNDCAPCGSQHGKSLAQMAAQVQALKLKLMFAESKAQTEEQTRRHAHEEIERLRADRDEQSAMGAEALNRLFDRNEEIERLLTEQGEERARLNLALLALERIASTRCAWQLSQEIAREALEGK